MVEEEPLEEEMEEQEGEETTEVRGSHFHDFFVVAFLFIFFQGVLMSAHSKELPNTLTQIQQWSHGSRKKLVRTLKLRRYLQLPQKPHKLSGEAAPGADASGRAAHRSRPPPPAGGGQT